jgi:hypothetical protein
MGEPSVGEPSVGEPSVGEPADIESTEVETGQIIDNNKQQQRDVDVVSKGSDSDLGAQQVDEWAWRIVKARIGLGEVIRNPTSNSRPPHKLLKSGRRLFLLS